MANPFEANRRAEDELRAILAARGERLDPVLLRRALAGAIELHPDREKIRALLDGGATLFVKPAGPPPRRDLRAALPPEHPANSRDDDLVISVGYPRDPRLCPPGAPAGRTARMGTIPMAAVLARPSAAEAGSN